MQQIKLTYKDYILSLRYSLYRLIELYGANTPVDLYVDNTNNQILSIIFTPPKTNYHITTLTLFKLLIYTIKYTNPDIDDRITTLRVYRYINKLSVQDLCDAIGITKEQYQQIETGFNPYLLDKLETQISSKLNINLDEYKNIRI